MSMWYATHLLHHLLQNQTRLADLADQTRIRIVVVAAAVEVAADFVED